MPLIKEILSVLEVRSFTGNDELEVISPIPFNADNTDPTALMWVNDKNAHLLSGLNTGIVLCSDKVVIEKRENINLIQIENPRHAFRVVLEKFFAPRKITAIAKSAVIHQSVLIGENASIGEHVVIEEGCIIGDDVEIGHNTVIFSGTVIGNQVRLGANNTIGGMGFGYERDQDGIPVFMPHLGNVILKDRVHTGSNTVIDRAVMGSTILEEGVKLDNKVHIAHGVIVGRNTLITANVMIAGSSIIGQNVWIAPSASIVNKISIGDNATIGMGAVVLKSVKAAEVVVGNPAKPLIKE